jgi:uridine kinase
VHTDDFASWTNPRHWWPRLIEEVLEPLSRGEAARHRRSRWDASDPALWCQIAPLELVVLEGVSATRDPFQPFLTYSVWVETPRTLRLSRGVERDSEEARGQREQWLAEEDEYVQRERPHERADVVVRGDEGVCG